MDTIPPFVFLVVALALLSIAGGLAFWLVNYIRGGGAEKPRERERLPTTETLAEPIPTGEIPAEPAPTAPLGAQELLSVYRTEKGELAVFVRGQRYYHLRGIKDRQLGNETIEAIKCVMAFAEGWLPTLRQEPAQPPSSKSTVDEDAFLEQLRQADLFPMEKKPPGLLDGLRRRGERRALAPLATPADAINDLVQEKLEERQDLARQHIQVITGADGGLCIRVGLQTYTAVADISPPEVRALVQDAIREWQES